MVPGAAAGVEGVAPARAAGAAPAGAAGAGLDVAGADVAGGNQELRARSRSRSGRRGAAGPGGSAPETPPSALMPSPNFFQIESFAQTRTLIISTTATNLIFALGPAMPAAPVSQGIAPFGQQGNAQR